MQTKQIKMKSDEATQSIEYTRTIVPSSMRSPYWKYFGFPSDNSNNILTKQKIICTLCNTAIAYNKNTSNLRTHLIAKHCELLHELQQQQQQHQQQQLQITNVRTVHKRTQSEIAVGQTHTTVVGSREKKLKDNSYALAQSDSSDAFITADYKQHTHSLIIDEVDDVIEMIEHGHAAESMSDVEGVDYADYETEQQPDESSEDQAERQKNDIDLEDVVQSQDESYEFMNIDNVSQKRSTVANGSNLDLQLEEMVVYMLITDLLPITTLDGVGFKRLFGHLGTLDKSLVEFNLSTMHGTMFEKITSHLKNICQMLPYSLGIEIGRNVELLPVISVYVNYYCVEENEFVNLLYQNIIVTEELQGRQKYEEFEDIFKEMNFANCAAFILNEPNAIIETFFREHNIPMVECLESVLMRCMQSIFELPSIKNDLKSVFKIVERSSLTLPEVYPKCPWSKLNLLHSIEDNLTYNTLLQSNAELRKARDLANYISPLKICLETIAEEAIPICSLMRPFTLRLLEDNFSTFFADNEYLSEVKNILTDELTNSVLKNSFLNESTFFDGRFRRDFLDASDLAAIKLSVCERFKTLLGVDDESSLLIKEEYSKTASTTSNSSSSSTSRKSSLKSFFQRNTEANQKQATFKKKPNMEYELNKYNCEPALDLEQCPASWWQENAFTYKQLKKVADYYLSVPCCVNRLFRLNISERNDLQNKRFMLRTQRAQEMWYLHYNKKYYDKLH